MTIVFEAMSFLENYGFILRQRRKIEELNSRRNVYQRPSCEHTIVRLLEREKIDGLLRPAPGFVNEMSDESRELTEEWLQQTLGADFAIYDESPLDVKRTVLIDLLKAKLRAARRPGLT